METAPYEQNEWDDNNRQTNKENYLMQIFFKSLIDNHFELEGR